MRDNSTLEIDESTKTAVAQWVKEIKSAKGYWEGDFTRMKKNMQFASGRQWAGQENMDSERYIANITLQMVANKVASLYAKNPNFEFKKRDRLAYQLWDGRLETLAVSIMQAQFNIESKAVILDYLNGNRIKELLDKVGKTLEVLFKYFTDSLQPDFKEQMKQMVRRTVITGVGYVKMNFIRDAQGEDQLLTSEGKVTMVKRLKELHVLMTQLAEGDLSDTDPKLEKLKILMEGLQSPETQTYAQQDLGERLTWDFPKSTSIIPSRGCTCLKGFIGARWVAEEHCIFLDDLNAFFGLNISVPQLDGWIGDSGQYQELKTFDIRTAASTLPSNPRVAVYEVYDKSTKTCFYVCDGYPDYLQKPEIVDPCTKNFYPWYSLTFNDVEADDEAQVSPFPPSDVELVKHAQMAINSARYELERHRKAKRPRTMVPKGTFTENDKENLQRAPSNSIIEVESAAALGDLQKVVQPFPTVPIDGAVYDTSPSMTDIFTTTGLSQQDFGIPQPHKKGETATAASITEQSKMSKSQSNVDDLDGLLSSLAENGGELLLHETSPQTVLRVCGPGAVWPITNRPDFINYIYLEAEAASSGRPNQAMEMAKWEKAAPILQAAGASPQFIVRQTLKVLDSKIDASEAFPLIPMNNARPADPFGAPPQPMGQENQQSPPVGQRTTPTSGNGQANPGQQNQQPQPPQRQQLPNGHPVMAQN